MNSAKTSFSIEQLQREIGQQSDTVDFPDYLYNDIGPLFYAFAEDPVAPAILIAA